MSAQTPSRPEGSSAHRRLRGLFVWIACAGLGVAAMRLYVSGGMQWALASAGALCGW